MAMPDVPGQPDGGGRIGTRSGKADHQQRCDVGGEGGGWFSRFCRESSNACGRCYKGAAAYPWIETRHSIPIRHMMRSHIKAEALQAVDSGKDTLGKRHWDIAPCRFLPGVR
jgi:hypothetical protein